MSKQKYEVQLTNEEKAQLQEILNKGIHPAKKVKRVKVSLGLDNMARCRLGRKFKPTLSTIAANCGVSVTTVHNISKQYNEQGVEATIRVRNGKHHRTSPSQQEKWRRA